MRIARRRAVLALCALGIAGAQGLAARAGQAAHHVYDIRVENMAVAGGQKVYRVRRGDLVEFRWTADRPTDIHLHGYNVRVVITAGAHATTAFTANATGRFAATLHDDKGKHRTLFYLEVHPR